VTPVPRDETLHLPRRLIHVTEIIDQDHQAATRATFLQEGRDRFEQAKSRRLGVQRRISSAPAPSSVFNCSASRPLTHARITLISGQ